MEWSLSFLIMLNTGKMADSHKSWHVTPMFFFSCLFFPDSLEEYDRIWSRLSCSRSLWVLRRHLDPEQFYYGSGASLISCMNCTWWKKALNLISSCLFVWLTRRKRTGIYHETIFSNWKFWTIQSIKEKKKYLTSREAFITQHPHCISDTRASLSLSLSTLL